MAPNKAGRYLPSSSCKSGDAHNVAPTLNVGSLAHAIRLLHSSEAIADTIERARQYARRAIDALARFPASKARAALAEAAEFAVARAY